MSDKLRILWMNWRCIRHPLAGGAEVYTHEVARRLARMGHEVVMIASRPKGLPGEETIDGYQVIRRGGKYTVYYQARRVYRELREREGWKPDVVIDEVNTIPFLTPFYAQEPIFVLIHQLCKDCWRYAVHPLLQPLGWWLEESLHKIYTRAMGGNKVRAVITVSESTKHDLERLGYASEHIHIVYNGLDWEQYRDCKDIAQEKEDIVTYIGRITPYKRLQDLLKAWKIVEQEYPSAELVIAGRPDYGYLKRLMKFADKLSLKRIAFRTNISQQEKKHLLAKAKLLVYTSIREGWGQTIIEAAACMTPAVAYNVAGLRDSIVNMWTGILVQQGDIKQLANALTTLLLDRVLRCRLAKNAYQRARKFNWDYSTKNFLSILNKYIIEKH